MERTREPRYGAVPWWGYVYLCKPKFEKKNDTITLHSDMVQTHMHDSNHVFEKEYTRSSKSTWMARHISIKDGKCPTSV